MPQIHLLPLHLANQIAAGEVVERPAAIVKELLENSLDAQADRISIRYQRGGKTFLSVEDNGTGMGAEDAPLAFQRHATSKLSKIQELEQLRSFGFRGEALPSIASVSRVLLQTKDEDSSHGTEILYHNGQCLHIKACSQTRGTRLTVTELFANVPARRRFLKGDAVEAWQIQQVVRAAALVQPQVQFELFDGHRSVLSSPGQILPALAAEGPALAAEGRGSAPAFRCGPRSGPDSKGIQSRPLPWTQRCAALFGLILAEELFDLTDEEDGVELQGALLKPGSSRFRPRMLWTFVNRRWVTSRFLQSLLLEAYHELLPVGRHPVAFLDIGLDPSLVDINVHPQKKEIRFRHERSLRATLGQLLHRALPKPRLFLESSPFREKSQDPMAASVEFREITAAAVRSQEPTATAVDYRGHGADPSSRSGDWDGSHLFTPSSPFPGDVPDSLPGDVSGSSMPALREAQRPFRLGTAYAQQIEWPHRDTFSTREEVLAGRWRFLGTLRSTYVLFEASGGLMLLHYRAAQERILYEELESKAGEVPSVQKLLLPLVLPARPDRDRSQRYFSLLREHGWDCQLDDSGDCTVEAIPSGLDPDKVALYAQCLWNSEEDDQDSEDNTPVAPDSYGRSLCRHYPHAPLSEATASQIEEQLARLLSCRQPLLSPDGRATYYEIPFREIEGRFSLS
ncbi:MAG: DNA mismatch repair endonuclease MutL [Puniceicoccales bacterium]|jgi:DNA mismatch repair protein MutL|nr:DNA mismatch repair endonuclease MutL [Puniceicoccales bacterium]